jgi:hypothetical protein
LDDIGVAKYLEDADLSGHSLDVRLLDYFLFLEGFYCHFLPRMDVHAHPHLAEGTLSDAFTSVIH